MTDLQQDVASILGVNLHPGVKPGYAPPRPLAMRTWSFGTSGQALGNLLVTAPADDEYDDEVDDDAFDQAVINMVKSLDAEHLKQLIVDQLLTGALIADNVEPTGEVLNAAEVAAWDKQYVGRYHPRTGMPVCHDCDIEILPEHVKHNDGQHYCTDCFGQPDEDEDDDDEDEHDFDWFDDSPLFDDDDDDYL